MDQQLEAVQPQLPQLLSRNGRLLWRLISQNGETCSNARQQENAQSNGPSYSLQCLDLLTNWTANYRLTGFRSGIGNPMALYWVDDGEQEDQLVLLDLNEQPGNGRFISQRKVQLDHFRREARWVGPLHRQYSTELVSVENIVVGQESIVLIGKTGAEWNAVSQLVLPLSPDDLQQSSEELPLNGMTPLQVTGGMHSLFFLGRPAPKGPEIEPSGRSQKLFMIAMTQHTAKANCAMPCIRVSRFCQSHLLPIQRQPNFPPINHNQCRVNHRGSRWAAALFGTSLSDGQIAWALGCLDTVELRWIGPLAEWTAANEEETTEAEVSRDGGVLLMTLYDGERQIKEIRTFRLPFSQRRVPSLSDAVLLAIQCNGQGQLKSDSLELLGQLRHRAFC